MSARLYQIQKDIPGHLWCGPATIAAVTGRPVSEVVEWVRWIREKRGAGFRRPAVKWMYASEVVRALQYLGFPDARCYACPDITFAQWRKKRTPEQRRRAEILLLTDHFVAVAGNRLVDNVHVDPILASAYSRQRALVRQAISLEAA